MSISSPVPAGCRYTSKFSLTRKLFGVVSKHLGSDYAPPTPGQSGVPVLAPMAGTIIASGWNVLTGHSGIINILDAGIVDGKRALFNFGHYEKSLVVAGQKVELGEDLGLMGKTGNVTGVHVHLGLRLDGQFVDPHAWFLNKGIEVTKDAPGPRLPSPEELLELDSCCS